MDATARRIPMNVNPAAASLAIVNPLAGRKGLGFASLFSTHPPVEQRVKILRDLCSHHLARDPSHRGLLLHGCYSKPQDIGADAAVLFGDYYFAEALLKVVAPGAFRPVPQRLSRREPGGR